MEVPSDCSTSTLRIERHQLAVKDIAERVQKYFSSAFQARRWGRRAGGGG